jgi:hypothetical protein
MQSRSTERGLVDLQGRELAQVGLTETSELVQQIRQRPSRGLAELCESIEWLERNRVAVIENPSDARHPVRSLPVDEMADHVDGAPSVAAFVSDQPAVGQTAKPGVQRARRAREKCGCLRDRQMPPRAVEVCGHAFSLLLSGCLRQSDPCVRCLLSRIDSSRTEVSTKIEA